jgi:hypothetical protein
LAGLLVHHCVGGLHFVSPVACFSAFSVAIRFR